MANRRTMIKSVGAVLAGTVVANRAFTITGENKTYKAVIIGRTGGGDYGHGLDTIFNGLENVHVAAVADHDENGRKQAAERSGAERTYADYREMLEKEKPDLVSIAPRQPDCHRDMALAVVEAGAHIYMEKPISEFPGDADEILSAAEKRGVNISVAHTKRYMDDFMLIKAALRDGMVGEIMEFRFIGKQDARAGGEDLIVLGSHDMDMMRYLLESDPQWCFATVFNDGKRAERKDVRKGNEPYTILGNTIRASYQFGNNIQCQWSSVKTGGDWNQTWNYKDVSTTKWGFTIFGTEKIISNTERIGTYVLDSPFITPVHSDFQWVPIQERIKIKKPEYMTHPIKNLIHAIETGSDPLCSGSDARWAIEMVQAVYQSHFKDAPVDFPLEDRGHPLL